MKSFTPEFERDRGGGVTRVSSKVILFTSLLVMNTRYLFLITALLSLPMFAWETVQAVIRHNSNYFYFFTITTNLLTWIYFISKASYVLFGHMQVSRKHPFSWIGRPIQTLQDEDRSHLCQLQSLH